MANTVKESADELIYIAENDIISAMELLAGTHYPVDRKYNIICFHITQAIEKFLKGYIIYNGSKIGKIHDLAYLHKVAASIDTSFSEIKNECILLNMFTPNLKYSSKKVITKQIMSEIIKSLQAICNFQPIKEMRDSLSKKYNYEIVAEIVSNQLSPN